MNPQSTRPLPVRGGPLPAKSTEDDRWVEGLRKGDEATFAVLNRNHSQAMLRIAKVYVSSHATAEDVVQETWLAILTGIGRFEQRSSLKTWMFHILANKARTAARLERRCVADPVTALGDIERDGSGVAPERFLGHPQRQLQRQRPPLPWDCPADDQLIVAHDVAAVRDAIADLPPIQRLVISLRDVDCWTSPEVCA